MCHVFKNYSIKEHQIIHDRALFPLKICFHSYDTILDLHIQQMCFVDLVIVSCFNLLKKLKKLKFNINCY
jgi:hypothetical protein